MAYTVRKSNKAIQHFIRRGSDSVAKPRIKQDTTSLTHRSWASTVTILRWGWWRKRLSSLSTCHTAPKLTTPKRLLLASKQVNFFLQCGRVSAVLKDSTAPFAYNYATLPTPEKLRDSSVPHVPTKYAEVLLLLRIVGTY